MKVIDLHAHAGPSVMPRAVDAAQMLLEAQQHHFSAFVVKDHYCPTMLSAYIAEKYVGDGSCRVFGGIALNNSVGGINLKAVDAAVAMGAKLVWMPTVSALRHKIMHSGKGVAFPASKGMSVAEKPIMYLQEDGSLQPQVLEVLDYLTKQRRIAPAIVEHRPRQPGRDRRADPCRRGAGRAAHSGEPSPLYDRRFPGGYGGLEPPGGLY